MDINIDQARRHIALLTGDEDTPVTFQVFYDPKDGTKRPDLAKHFEASLSDSIAYLQWAQSQKCGVYVGINGTDGIGREYHNIKQFRAVFADFDGMNEPKWDIIPHFVTKRDEQHGHAFWLVSDVIDVDTFRSLQRRIHLKYGTDEQVTDPTRVVRLCGFNHYKNPNQPAQYSVIKDATKLLGVSHRYSVAELTEAFSLDAVKDAELTAWLERSRGLDEGTGYEYNERYAKKFINWCTVQAPIAILGSGTLTVVKVASYAHDHGLPLAETQEIMWECYNPRCQPPWQEHEKRHFYNTVENAFRYAHSEAGCKTAVAEFTRLPTLPEPVGGWDADKKRAEKQAAATVSTTVEQATELSHRITKEQATILLPQLTAKSPHYEFARCFDGILFNGQHIIRNDEMFYTFNGKSWQVTGDDVIKAKCQAFLATFKPADSMTRGIYNCLKDLVNENKVEVGQWLDGKKREGDYIVMQNGLLHTHNGVHQLLPHDHNYFSFNELTFNYEPTAYSSTWLAMLRSVFPTDTMLHAQLQEWFGYNLTSDNRYQKMAIFLGKSRAGKGVIADVMSKLVGELNTASPQLSNIAKDSTLYEMSKVSTVLIPDAHNVNYNQRDSVISLIKAISGGDSVSYHVLYKGTQTSKFPCKFTMSTNNMPEFVDSSGAFANRLLIFPFMISFAGREDPDLRDKLFAEVEGIFTWALEGLTRLRQHNSFTLSPSGLEELEEIREDLFPLAKFIRARCEVVAGSRSSCGDIYAAYRIWCAQHGQQKPMTEIQVTKCLRNSDLAITYKRKRVGEDRDYGFDGLTIKPLEVNNNVVNFPPTENSKNA